MDNRNAYQYQLAVTDRVKKLSKPLELFNINFFGYARMFHDGRYFVLGNDIDFSCAYIETVDSDYCGWGAPLVGSSKKIHYNISTWPIIPQNKAMEFAYKNGYWNGISFSKYLKDYDEVWCFGGPISGENIQNCARDNQEDLLLFIQSLNLSAPDLLEMHPDKLAVFKNGKLKPPEIEQEDTFLPPSNLSKEFRQQLKDTMPKYKRLLAPTELKVLFYISKNFSTGEIAHSLDISKRTVEDHIENIRRKLSIGKRSELSAYFHDNLSYVSELFLDKPLI